jgi:hypothetical protein
MAPMDPLPRIGRLYLLLFIFRLVNAWLIQTQFDPDEYWQTLEPAYCEVFSEYPCTYTWEWTKRASHSNDGSWLSRFLHGPIRSYVSVLPTYIWYRLVKWRGLDVLFGSWVVSKGPILVHAVLVAAPIDLCIWLLGRHAVSAKRSSQVSSFAWWPLFLSLTSWFQAYGMIRTYSNSMEAMLLAVGVTLVGTVRFDRDEGPRLFESYPVSSVTLMFRSFLPTSAFLTFTFDHALRSGSVVSALRFASRLLPRGFLWASSWHYNTSIRCVFVFGICS